MNKMYKKFLFVSSLPLFSLCALFQVPAHAMEQDTSDEKVSLQTPKKNRDEKLYAKFEEIQDRIEKLRISEAKKITDRDDELDAILTPLGHHSFSHLYDVFDTLEESAKAADLNGKHDEAARLWEGMAAYADAIVDSSSKYHQKYGMVLDFGAMMQAERDKQKEIPRRKEMGLKGAAENFLSVQEYSKSGEMWDRLKEHRDEQGYKSLTLDEARKAVQAYHLAENFQKEFDYRNLMVEYKAHTSEDTLEWADALWRFKLEDPNPNIACWEVMKRSKETNPEIYNRAFELFQKNDATKLKKFMVREEKRNRVDAELEQKFNSMKIEPDASFDAIFKILEIAAQSAHLDGKNVEEAQYWEAMGFYAEAIDDHESKFFIKLQEASSSEEIRKALKEKELAWTASIHRKNEGFKKALKAYSLTDNDAKLAEMWDEFSKCKLLKPDDLRAAANAHQKAGNFEKEIEYRFKLKEKEITCENLLDLARRLWETGLGDNSKNPEDYLLGSYENDKKI